MIKTILIEDEFNARSALKKMLNILDSNINIIAETGHVSEALNLIKTKKPDLIFLDIELEDGKGFDILEQLDTIDFKLIFTTAYNQYAINAFKFSAIDYLLKPIDPNELQHALERAMTSIKYQKEHLELLEILENNLEKKEQKIVLKTTEQRYIIAVNNIIRLEADGAYTIFITKNQKIIVSKHLKFYQELLDEQFIRCHQSHLVNKNHIKGIDTKGFLLLSNEQTVPISTRKKNEILKIINAL